MITASKNGQEGSEPSFLHIDIETYSKTDLGTHGVYRYTEDPSFKILLFAYAYNDEPVQIVDLDNGEALPKRVQHDLTDPAVLKVAFNAAFERICLSRFLGMPDGVYLDPDQWRCARAQSLYLGVGSASLENVGLFLGIDKQKLESGKSLIALFSVDQKTKKAASLYGLSPDDKRVKRHHEPQKWELFKTYCKRDVEAEREIWDKDLSINEMPLREWQIYAMSERINDRGVLVNQDLCRQAIKILERFVEEKLEGFRKKNPDLNVRSSVQVIKWFEDHEVLIEKAGKEQMQKILDDPDMDDEVKEVARLRLEVNKNAPAKFQAFLDVTCKDGRARGLFSFYGAHTGRWVSIKVNLQNLPRPSFSLEEFQHARDLVLAGDYEALKDKFPAVSDVLATLIRTVIIAEPVLSVCDFSAIEARIAPYVSDETWQLEAFNNDEDIYCTTASLMYGVPVEKNGVNGHLRKLGKLAVLSCNYSSGAGSLHSRNPGMKYEDVEEMVKKYRQSVSNITSGWYQLEDCARRAIRTGKRQDWKHGVSFYMNGDHLLCELPCGRRLCYAKASIKSGEIKYHEIGRAGEKELSTYGGKLFENVVQSIARDCLATTLLRIEQAGLPIIGHVHDEVLVEGSCLNQIKEIFSKPIPYLPGLQLKGEGFEGSYYRKD